MKSNSTPPEVVKLLPRSDIRAEMPATAGMTVDVRLRRQALLYFEVLGFVLLFGEVEVRVRAWRS